MHVLKLQRRWKAEHSWSHAKSIGMGFERVLEWISADASGTVKCLLVKVEDNSGFSLEEASPTKNLTSSVLHRNREDCYEERLRE